MKHDEFQLDRIREDQLVLMEEIEKLRKDIRYIHNKIDQGSSHIIRQNPVIRNRRYHDTEPEYNDSYSSDYDSGDDSNDDSNNSDDSSEGEYEYNGRY